MIAAMQRRIARSATVMSAGNLLSRLLGLVREQLIAALFGRSAATDAFVVAENIARQVYDLMAGRLIDSALVPVFSQAAAADATRPLAQATLWRLVSRLLSLAVAAVTLVVGLLLLAVPLLVQVMGAGFDPAVKTEAEGLARIALFAVIAMAGSAVLTATLYALQEFTFPAFAPALFNLGIIVLALMLHQNLGVASLAWGMVAGAAAQLGLLILPLLRRRAAIWPDYHWCDPVVRQVVWLYLPVAAGLFVSIAATILDRSLASLTGPGSIAAMKFATTLIQFPLGLVQIPIASATLPLLARHADDLPHFRQTLAAGLRLILLLILPAAVGLAILAMPVVALVFQHGLFTAADTAVTALALWLYLPGLVANALDLLLVFAFYAQKDTRTPVLIGVVSIGFYLLVALPTVGPMGMPGLVLANSAQWTSHLVISAGVLAGRIGGWRGLGLGLAGRQVLLASLAMAGIMLVLTWGVTVGIGGNGPGGQLLTLLVAGGGGVLSYGMSLLLMGVEEANQFWQQLRQR